jgi:hypothetical protein
VHNAIEAKMTASLAYLTTTINTMHQQRVAEQDLHLEQTQEWIDELKRLANSYLQSP